MFFKSVRNASLTIVFLALCFCNAIAAVDLQSAPDEIPANNSCYGNGDIVTLRGTASAQSLTLSNDAVTTVWVLTTDRPICIIQPSGDETPQTTDVLRFQIIGPPPPVDTAIELKGKLSTGNDPQDYAEFDAIEVISGRRISDQPAVPMPNEINSLINIEEQLNDKCREGPGNAPATEKACTDREKYFDKISSLGWCWGKLGQVEEEKTWHKCGKDSEQKHTTEEVKAALVQRFIDGPQQGEAPTPNEISEEKEISFPRLLLVLMPPFVLIWMWVWVWMRKKRRKLKFKNKLKELVETHIQALSRKRSQMVFKDDYGNLITAAWEKKKAYFRDNVVFPLFSASDGRIYATLRTSVESIVEAAVDACMLNEDAREIDGLIFSPAMSPYDYEKFCAELLKKAGWDARATKASGDQGSDVIAERNGTRIVLQCKLYTQPVGNKAVQEVFAAKTFEQADHAAVVTNETYTPSARKIAMSTGISLLHHNELLQWARTL